MEASLLVCYYLEPPITITNNKQIFLVSAITQVPKRNYITVHGVVVVGILSKKKIEQTICRNIIHGSLMI